MNQIKTARSELQSKVGWTRFDRGNAMTLAGRATEAGRRQPEPEPWNRN